LLLPQRLPLLLVPSLQHRAGLLPSLVWSDPPTQLLLQPQALLLPLALLQVVVVLLA
jgi:hypothetical protein